MLIFASFSKIGAFLDDDDMLKRNTDENRRQCASLNTKNKK